MAPDGQIEDWLRGEGAALGFDALRITRLEGNSLAAARLRAFLNDGRHGSMDWMETHADRRADPRTLWPEARSAVMVGLSYAPSHDPLEALAAKGKGVISVYAQGKDYHDILKPKLKQLARAFSARSGSEVKVFVDTAPVMEKPLAAAAGIGWQGKHTNLVSRTEGSWLFLGAMLTTAVLEPDEPEQDHCGSCTRCLEVCPTDAFPAPYQLDARRCIAYLTIEHKGPIPHEYRSAIANRVFGCDDCLAVCPWNKFAAVSREARFQARLETDNPPLADLLSLSEESFRARFAGTPVKRTGRDRFLRNVLIAAGNSSDPGLAPLVRQLASDPAPLVRGAAAWALRHLLPDEDYARARTGFLAVETDANVRAEWLSEMA